MSSLRTTTIGIDVCMCVAYKSWGSFLWDYTMTHSPGLNRQRNSAQQNRPFGLCWMPFLSSQDQTQLLREFITSRVYGVNPQPGPNGIWSFFWGDLQMVNELLNSDSEWLFHGWTMVNPSQSWLLAVQPSTTLVCRSVCTGSGAGADCEASDWVTITMHQRWWWLTRQWWPMMSMVDD